MRRLFALRPAEWECANNDQNREERFLTRTHVGRDTNCRTGVNHPATAGLCLVAKGTEVPTNALRRARDPGTFTGGISACATHRDGSGGTASSITFAAI